jgi:hypothetical protein
VWGTPPDLMQLGPPWTKWPGGSLLFSLRTTCVAASTHLFRH